MWRGLVEQYLRPFEAEGGITFADVERTEQWAANATAFSATGSWRAQVVGGVLYVKMIRAHKHWAERASVLRMLISIISYMPTIVEAWNGRWTRDMTST